MLKLKLQYFSHLMPRADLLEKTLMLGEIEGKRRRGQQRMRWLDGITNSMDKFEQTREDSEGQGSCCAAVQGSQRVGHYLVTEQQQFSNSCERGGCYFMYEDNHIFVFIT